MKSGYKTILSICSCLLAACLLTPLAANGQAAPAPVNGAEKSAAERLQDLKNKAGSSTARAIEKLNTAEPEPPIPVVPKPPPVIPQAAPPVVTAPAVPSIPPPALTAEPATAPKSVALGEIALEDVANTNAVPGSFSLEPSEQLSDGIELEESEVDDELISVTLDDVPLKDVIRMFSRISGANIIATDDLDGRVTVSLQDVEWKVAMEAILDRSGHTMIEKHKGIYSVISKSELAAEPVTVETVILDYVTVTNVLPIVTRMLISTNSSVTPLPAANALVIQETAQQLVAIKAVIKTIDKPRQQVFIEAKFVELNDQAIEDLGINWEVLQGYTVTAGSLNRDYTATRSRTEQNAKVAFITGEDTRRDINLDERIRQNDSFSDNFSQRTGDTFDNNTIGTTFSNLRTSNETSTSGGARSQQNNSGSNFDNQNRAINNALNLRTTENGTIVGNSVQNAVLQGINFETAVFDDDAITITPTEAPPFVSTDIRSAILSADDFQMTLSALKQLDGVEIVSNPKILVANGEEATIHVGRNEPNVVAVPTGDSGDRFAFQLDKELPFIEIGVKLSVKPTINTEENITIKITPELSRLLGQKIVGEANTSFPITQIRKINTEFNLESGKTVAIGGLTETSENEAIRKIPILGDIPIIGKYLFTHTHTEETQDEVMIFVTVDMGNPPDLVDDSGIPRTSTLIHAYQKKLELLEKAAKEAEEGASSDTPDERTVDEILADIKKDNEDL